MTHFLIKFLISARNVYKLLFLIEIILNLNRVRCESSFHVPDYEMVKRSLKLLPLSKCKDDLNRYVNGLEEQEKWAMKMFDATVKFPFGLLNGNSYQLGNFDECIEVSVPPSSSSNDLATPIKNESKLMNTIMASFTGQYCLAEISVNKSEIRQNFTEEEIFNNRKFSDRHNMKKIFWAICIPSSCQANETGLFLNQIFTDNMPNKQLQVTLTSTSCYYKIDETLTPGQIIYCVIIGIFLCFVLSSTCYHYIHIYKKRHFSGYTINRTRQDYSLLHEVVVSFSVIKNVKKIMESRSKNNDFNLDCISGIRTISMAFIIAGHALSFLLSSPVLNKHFHEDAIQKVQNAVFLNNPLLVDTFLLVSGFLLCRLLLIELEKRAGKVNIFILYLARYIRLTPPYAVVLGFYCTFLPKSGSGPLWTGRMTLEQERCLSSWWANILYINNYVNTDQLCMFQSWYLSVDTQLFVLAPIIIFPLWYKRILGEIFLTVLCITSGIVPFMITFSQHLDPTLMIYPSEINDLSNNYYFKNYYIKTHMRANAYLMGLLFGSVVHRMQSKSAKIPFITRILAGISAIIVGAASMFSIVIFYQPDYVYNASEAGLYAALHRIAWCCAVGWTLIVCVTSKSYIENFLSWKAWGPLSKLTYCAYLTNGFVELYSYGLTRSPRYLSIYTLGSETTAHIVMTVVSAFILCVLFESPIHNMEKLLLRKKTRQKNEDTTSSKRPEETETTKSDISEDIS